MDSTTLILTFLDRVGRRGRRLLAVSWALWSGAALTAGLVLLALLAPALAPGGARTLARAGLAVALVGLVGTAIWALVRAFRTWGLFGGLFGGSPGGRSGELSGKLAQGQAGGALRRRPGWADPQPQRVARFVGRQQPALASDLRSAVELGLAWRHRAGPGATPTCSHELLAAFLDRTAARLAGLTPAALVPVQPAQRSARALAGALVLVAAATLLAPARFGRGLSLLVAGTAPDAYAGAARVVEPIVGDVDITLEYPAYTGRPPARLPGATGELRVLPGTVVRIETAALAPVTSAQIRFGDEERGAAQRPPLALTVAGRQLRGAFEVLEPLQYRFLLEHPQAGRRVEAVPHAVELERDQIPVVELHAPAEELDVTGMKRIELAYIGEDDFGIARVELVWELHGRSQRKLLAAGAPRKSAQGKFLWDLAELSLPTGARVPYHVEVTDNDSVLGPNVGRSRQFYLRVFSPRERHEQLMERQVQLFDKLVRLLGARLTIPAADLPAHQQAHRDTTDLVRELGTLLAALAEDQLVHEDLRTTLKQMRTRLDRLLAREAALLGRSEPGGAAPGKGGAERFAELDRASVAELENDVLALADWLDRQRMEDLLGLSDEVKNHKDRLRKLLAEYARTGAPEVMSEIQREMRALEQRLAEMAQRQQGLGADVLDQFVNADALAQQQSRSCLEEVQALLARGQIKAAQSKLEDCSRQLDSAAASLEQSLAELRGDRFPEAERKFGELMNELADITRDQEQIAGEADAIWQRYARQAAERLGEQAAAGRKEMQETVAEMRRQLDGVPPRGLSQFSREELEVVRKRLDDLDTMLRDSDFAEALNLARQAQSSLETAADELADGLDEHARWADDAETALERIHGALPLARKLVQRLQQNTPRPGEIMSRQDEQRLGELSRRQQTTRQQAQRLAGRARSAAGELPGGAGGELGQKLEEAGAQMERAGERMKARDPAAARMEARAAAERLAQARQQAQGAARLQRQSGSSGLRDEPVRIPGADEYRAPEKFREDILDAMKKETAPESYRDLVKRYYEELIR